MDQDKESRKYKRYDVERIHGNVLNATDLDILNISIDGAAIETPKRLELNMEYTFKIKSQNDSLNIKGRVVWANLISKEEKDSNRVIPVYRVGIKFTETLNEKGTRLQNFIEENRTKPLEHRLGGGRFKIAKTENFQLDYPYEYEVKKISMSGMLIETQYSLDPGSSHYVELFICNERLNIEGRIVSCERKDSQKGARYNIGMEFINVPEEDGEILKDFLETLD